MTQNTRDKILSELRFLVQPIIDLLSPFSKSKVYVLFYNMGIDLDKFVGSTGIDDAINTVQSSLQFSQEDELSIENIKVILDNLKGLTIQFKSEFLDEINAYPLHARFIDYLLARYLYLKLPLVFSFFEFLGLVKLYVSDLGRTYRFISLTEIKENLSNPWGIITKTYGWTNDSFDYILFISRLNQILEDLGIKVQEQISTLPTGEEESEPNVEVISKVVILSIFMGDIISELGIKMVPSFKANQPIGLQLIPYADSEFEGSLNLGESAEVKFDSSINLESPLIIDWTKDDIQLFQETVDDIFQFNLLIQFRKLNQDNKTILLGNPAGTQLSSGGAGFELGFSHNESTEFILKLKAEQSSLVISPENTNNFLQKLIKEPLKIDFGISIIYSSINGLFIQGGGKTEIVIPIHKKVGPIIFQEIDLFLEVVEEQINFDSGLSVSLSLGPLDIALKSLGLASGLKLGEGNLGFADASFPSVKLPTGASLSLSSAIVSGGGFLDYNKIEGSYAGILALSLQKISVTAIGLIQTKLPNGQDGFSMVISISTIFNPGLPLPFGLSLNGVGGLLAVNRRMDVEELKSRINTGSIDSLMFPENALESADRIISDMRSIFPAREDSYVLGPFIRIGWGTPTTLIFVDLGIFIQLPNPTIILLGRLRTELPVPQDPIIILNIEVLGELNPAEKYLEIRGTLRGSKIASINLGGDFFFYLNWSRQKQFFFSVGGYNPGYQKPAGIPDLNRLSASLAYKKDKWELDFGIAMYLAITPNTFQIGFATGLQITYRDSFLGAEQVVYIKGEFDFDVLIYFNPFRFKSDLSFDIEVGWKDKEFLGIELEMTLKGPAPWHASGFGALNLGIITLEKDFDLKWGRKDQAELPQIVNPTSQLTEALEADSSWSSEIAIHKRSVEKFVESDSPNLLLHPSGLLAVQQNVLPLDIEIETLGNAELEHKGIYSLAFTEDNGDPISEYFAPAQFTQLTEEERLSRPDFEAFHAGVQTSLGEENIDLAEEEEVSIESAFEDIIIYDDLSSERFELIEQEPAIALGLNAAGRFFSEQIAYLEGALPQGIVQWAQSAGIQILDEQARPLEVEARFSSITRAAQQLKKRTIEPQTIFQKRFLDFNK